MTEKVVRFEEHDEAGVPTGRFVSFLDVEFLPLSYSDLIDRSHGDAVIPLSWKNARVAASNIPGITPGTTASVRTTLQSVYSLGTIGLIKGGWLPAGLALRPNMIVMPDRCTISDIRGRFRNGDVRRGDAKDFLDFFTAEGIRLNPLLWALEGNQRRNPTAEEIEEQVNEVTIALKIALPKAELLATDPQGVKGVVGLIEDTQASMQRKSGFLMHFARKLCAPVSAIKRELLWEEVLRAAPDYGVQKGSLVVLAVLSSISVPNGRSPARRVLKFTDHYSEDDAYNALADLQALELLMSLFAVFPDQPLMLCTGDKALAQFWAGIRASDFAWDGRQVQFRIAPVEELLPTLTAEQDESYFGGGELFG